MSPAPRTPYYIGECRPCRATISEVVARLSAVGYSGTNATGVVIRDSLWDRNGAGIVPNTYANEALPPQARTTIVANTVTNSGRARAPIRTALAGFIGIGIGVGGGKDNDVRANRVRASERYGIAVFPTARRIEFTSPVARDPGPPWQPSGNMVTRNAVSGSGRADLVLANGGAAGNCFRSNAERTSLPPRLDAGRCTRAGDAGVTSALTAGTRRMFEAAVRKRRPPDYTEMPEPPSQPSMP